MINGKIIKLRPFEKSDLEISKRWINDPEISKAILRVLPVSMFEHENWYEKIINDKTRITFAIETIKEGEYVGNTGIMEIDWRSRKGKYWIYLDKKAWNKGYGKEAICLTINFAFYSLNLKKIYLEVAKFNSRAIEVYIKIGFKKEAIFKKEVFIDGKYVDIIRMAIFKEEMRNK